jgi:hypothetical protein
MSWGARNGVPSTVLSGTKSETCCHVQGIFVPCSWNCVTPPNHSCLSNSAHSISVQQHSAFRLYNQPSTHCSTHTHTHNRCAKASPTCFGTPLVPSSGSLPSSYSSAIEMVRSTQHCHTHTHSVPGLHYPYLGLEVVLERLLVIQ